MRIVIFGLTISSSWGNGHATLWRSLVKAMLRRGHTVVFYEKNVSYYAAARDLDELPQGATLRLYGELKDIRAIASSDLDDADLALCTSYCPDGPEACELLFSSRAAIKAFYDLDTPVTLAGLDEAGSVAYLPVHGLRNFDLVLSFTGGNALRELERRLGARVAVAWYGSVDPENHRPAESRPDFRCMLSYLGTYAADRQEALVRLFVRPSEHLSDQRFLIGGAQYPDTFPWRPNIHFARHVAPSLHPAFFSSCHATLNVTRGVMARYGFCPSGRLFEAAASGAVVLSDYWEGLEGFLSLGKEVLRVDTTTDVLAALALSDAELRAVALAAQERVLADHTGEQRIKELESICDAVFAGTAARLPQEVAS